MKSTLTVIPSEEHDNNLLDLIPDVIPEQKKPLEESDSENDEDYSDETKLYAKLMHLKSFVMLQME